MCLDYMQTKRPQHINFGHYLMVVIKTGYYNAIVNVNVSLSKLDEEFCLGKLKHPNF